MAVWVWSIYYGGNLFHYRCDETETEMYFSNQTHIQGSCLNFTT